MKPPFAGLVTIPCGDGSVITPNNVYFVDAAKGSDDNDGRSPLYAKKTVTSALAKCVTNQNDCVAVIPSGLASGTAGGAATAETAAITWDKSLTHLVGLGAPVQFSHRARISTSTASLSPFFNITGRGCTFSNVQISNFTATGLILTYITGDNNYFHNVHFAGIGHATAGADTSSRVISMVGAHENLFRRCTIGIDTVARSAANAEIECANTGGGAGGCARNIFEECNIVAYCTGSGTGHFFLIADSNNDIDRFLLFKRCFFSNAVNVGSAVTMTDAFSLSTALGGTVVVWDSVKTGTTGWADNTTCLLVGGFSSNATYANGIGFPVAPGA